MYKLVGHLFLLRSEDVMVPPGNIVSHVSVASYRSNQRGSFKSIGH